MLPVTLKFTGDPIEGKRCLAIIDYIRMELVPQLHQDWLVLGPFPNPEHKGFATVYPPEEQTRIRPASTRAGMTRRSPGSR